MYRNLKKALKTALDAPLPTRKESFLQTLPAPKTTKMQFYQSQIGYIRKRFWLLSLLLLAGMYCFVIRIEHNHEITGFISACLPLLTLTGIGEIKKSDTFNMNELEMSCKYDLSKIILFRLSAISIFHLMILLLSFMLFKNHSQFETIRYMIYITTPFLLSSLISLWILNRTSSKDSLYVCSGVTIFISLTMFLLNLGSMGIYADQYEILWQTAFLIILALLFKESHQLLTQGVNYGTYNR